MKVLIFQPDELLETQTSREAMKKDLVIFLHGFPSLRSKQNRELAKIVSQTNLVDVWLPLYPGLGFSEGRFSFSSCLELVQNWASSRLKEKRRSGWTGRLQIVGHSWGGFLGLALAQLPDVAVTLSKMVLMSPLVHFAPPSEVSRAFQHMTAQSDLKLDLLDIESLAKDFERVGKNRDVAQLIRNLPSTLKVDYLQARTDQMTPPEVAEKMRVHFKCQLNFQVVDQDHSFLSDRSSLGLELARLLRS